VGGWGCIVGSGRVLSKVKEKEKKEKKEGAWDICDV
jgi:hypothetical protein